MGGVKGSGQSDGVDRAGQAKEIQVADASLAGSEVVADVAPSPAVAGAITSWGVFPQVRPTSPVPPEQSAPQVQASIDVGRDLETVKLIEDSFTPNEATELRVGAQLLIRGWGATGEYTKIASQKDRTENGIDGGRKPGNIWSVRLSLAKSAPIYRLVTNQVGVIVHGGNGDPNIGSVVSLATSRNYKLGWSIGEMGLMVTMGIPLANVVSSPVPLNSDPIPGSALDEGWFFPNRMTEVLTIGLTAAVGGDDVGGLLKLDDALSFLALGEVSYVIEGLGDDSSQNANSTGESIRTAGYAGNKSLALGGATDGEMQSELIKRGDGGYVAGQYIGEGVILIGGLIYKPELAETMGRKMVASGISLGLDQVDHQLFEVPSQIFLVGGVSYNFNPEKNKWYMNLGMALLLDSTALFVDGGFPGIDYKLPNEGIGGVGTTAISAVTHGWSAAHWRALMPKGF